MSAEAREARLRRLEERWGELRTELGAADPGRANRLAAFEAELRGEAGAPPALPALLAWRDKARERDLGAEAVEQRIAACVRREDEAWEERAKRAREAADVEGGLALLEEISARIAERQRLLGAEEARELERRKGELRAAVEAALKADALRRESRYRHAAALLDASAAALGSLDDWSPAEAVERLLPILGDVEWYLRVVERERHALRARLVARRRRLKAEIQERRLQVRMEQRFGVRFVGGLERVVLLLIFVVLGILAAEVLFTFSETTRYWLTVVDVAACGVFLFEFFLKLAHVQGRGSWFARHFLVDFVPSIPFGLLLLDPGAADPARAGRLLRLLRLTRVARYVRLLMPVIRLVRAFGFLTRGIDRLARRFRPLLDRDVILYPNRHERERAKSRARSVEQRSRLLLGELAREWEGLLDDAPAAQRAAIFAARVPALESGEEVEVAEEPSGGETTAGALLDRLAAVTPEELEEELDAELLGRLARSARLFSRAPLRWLPVLRRYVPRVRKDASDAEVIVATAHRSAAELGRHHERLLWFADLHGTVTPSESVDRVGTALVKSSFRPAYRLLLFGGFYLLVQGILGLGDMPLLENVATFLAKFVGPTLVLLGSICLVILSLGWWMRRVADEATAFLERTVNAQFLRMTEALRSRWVERDARLLERRVLRPEAALLEDGDGLDEAERARRLAARVHAWLVEARAGHDASAIGADMERVALLYRDNLDGALLVESDTRTAGQLLGSPALQQFLEHSRRIGKRERRELEMLDLERGGGLRGPYLWFSLVSRSVARSVARLVVEYNRNALPLRERERASEDERRAFEAWLAAHPARTGRPPEDGEPAPLESECFLTTAFTALHFLDDDPERDAELERQFGADVLELVRTDRRLLMRRIFGSFPLHALPRSERVLNLFRFYENWFAGGRALLVPFRLLGLSVGMLWRGCAWTASAVREVRRPRLRTSHEEASQADFATAVRKIDRMRGPSVRATLMLRARVDPEYLGIALAGGFAAPARAEVDEDLRFLEAPASLRRRVEAERDAAVADMRRLQRLLDDGLLDRLAASLGVSAEAIASDPATMRALAVAYRSDLHGVRVRLSAREMLEELADGAHSISPAGAPPVADPRLRSLFAKWWGERPGDASAVWQAVRANHLQSAEALRAWGRDAGAGARADGERELAETLRHPGRLSEQLLTLRTVQTMSLIDVLHYREQVFRVGDYAASGDDPGDLLELDALVDAQA